MKYKSNKKDRSNNKLNLKGELIYGIHSALAAINNHKREIYELFVTSNVASKYSDVLKLCEIEPQVVTSENISKLTPTDAVHQGIAVRVSRLPEVSLYDLDADGIIVILDQLYDPHNIGAIIRSCAAFKVSAIVMTERNSPELNGVLAKSASGAIEHVPIIRIGNLARSMKELKKLGYFIIGLDSEAKEDIFMIQIPDNIAIVFGSEGRGLRRLTRDNCDLMAKLDLPGEIKSLNVSNAVAVCLAAISKLFST